MPNISDLLKEKNFEYKKARKNEEQLYLIERLSELSGWQKRSIYFKVPHIHLQRAIEYIEGFSNPKLRNAKLKEFISLIKK